MTATMWTAADLIFDPDTHTSRMPDGTDVPHVTAILSAVGVATDFDELAALGAGIAMSIEDARALGTAVHADAHAYDDGDIVMSTVDRRVMPYLEAWALVRAEKGLTPVARERRLYHAVHHYTGITDGVFVRPSGRRVVIDIKTGDPSNAAAAYQTAAYEEAWNWMFPDLAAYERWAVWLTPGRRVPYRIFDYSSMPDAHMDFPKFLACRTVYGLQVGRVKALQF